MIIHSRHQHLHGRGDYFCTTCGHGVYSRYGGCRTCGTPLSGLVLLDEILTGAVPFNLGMGEMLFDNGSMDVMFGGFGQTETVMSDGYGDTTEVISDGYGDTEVIREDAFGDETIVETDGYGDTTVIEQDGWF